MHGKSEPQPGGSKFCSAPPLASELHWPSLFGSFGNWASFWSLPKLFFLRRELAPCAGQFRMFVCGSCTYLRNCLPLRLSWHSVPGSFGRLFAVPAPICGVSWHWSCRRCRCAGQFRTCFRFCGIGFGDPPPICGISGPREGVPGSFGTLCAVPAPICGIVCCCAVNWRSVPGSFGLCFGFYAIG